MKCRPGTVFMRRWLRVSAQLMIWSKTHDACNKEIARQQELNKALESTIVAAIGDNKFAKYLLKVFKKKIKRRKKSEARLETG